MICESELQVYFFAAWCLGLGLLMGYALWGISHEEDKTGSKHKA